MREVQQTFQPGKSWRVVVFPAQNVGQTLVLSIGAVQRTQGVSNVGRALTPWFLWIRLHSVSDASIELIASTLVNVCYSTCCDALRFSSAKTQQTDVHTCHVWTSAVIATVNRIKTDIKTSILTVKANKKARGKKTLHFCSRFCLVGYEEDRWRTKNTSLTWRHTFALGGITELGL